ncbi:DnaJ central domain protein, partial [Ostertagia ostertagi]
MELSTGILMRTVNLVILMLKRWLWTYLLRKAVRGTQKNIFVNVVEDCPRCKGTQVEPGYKKVSCPYCNGTGMITQRLQGGFFYQASCNRCGGSGHYNKDGAFNWDSYADSQFGHSHAQEMVMDISFEEAVRGTQKNIFVNVVEDCPRCKGTQVEPGYKKVSCPYCNGTGMITQRLQGGFFYQASCNRCGGSGHYNKNPCQECEGHGQSVQRRQVSFSVPAGTNDKDRVRFQVGK